MTSTLFKTPTCEDCAFFRADNLTLAVSPERATGLCRKGHGVLGYVRRMAFATKCPDFESKDGYKTGEMGMLVIPLTEKQ